MKQPRDDKFVITKAPVGAQWTWIAWLPVGQRWLQTADKSTTFSAFGAGVVSFQAAKDLVAQRLAGMQQLADDVDALYREVS